MKRSYFKNKPRREMKRVPLSRSKTPLKRTKLRKVGVIGKANIKANKRIRENMVDIVTCEVVGKECLGGMFLTNAHRHKRVWYQGDVDLLSDPSQVIKACVNCHNDIEFDEEMTEEIFTRLRGAE